MASKIDDGIISLETDITGAMNLFRGMDVNKKFITKKLLQAVGTGGRTAIRRAYRKTLKKRSGTLYKSIRSYVRRNGYEVVFTNNANSGKKTSADGRIARYGFMLASGYTIPKKDTTKLLTFQIDGKWFRKHSVTVQARDFTEGPLDRYVTSVDMQERLDKALDKQIAYWEKRTQETKNIW